MIQNKNIKLTLVDEVTSTNDVIKKYALNGADDLTAVHANIQTQGRGRRGRTWATIPNQSMACSILVRGDNFVHLPLITALAVFQTVKEYISGAEIKWPNDVLVNGKKISGILVERHTDKDQGFYIVGVGLNVGMANPEFWRGLSEATSLQREGASVSLEEVIKKFCDYFSQILTVYKTEGWEGFIASTYVKNCGSIGKNVRWINDGKEIKGIAQSIDSHGTLLLKLEDATIIKVLSGDIIKGA